MHTHLKPTGGTSCDFGRPGVLLSRTGLHQARFWPLAPVLLLASLLSPDRTAAPNSDRGRELLVKWKDGPSSAAAAAGNARIGGTVKRSFHAVGWQLVELPPGMNRDEGLQAYRSLDAVLLAEPDPAMELTMPPPTSGRSRRVARKSSWRSLTAAWTIRTRTSRPTSGAIRGRPAWMPPEPTRPPMALMMTRTANRASVEAALDITPPVAGTFEWSADNRNLVLRHDLPLDTTTPYTVRLRGIPRRAEGQSVARLSPTRPTFYRLTAD